jgi:phosphoadenosine phosphosulfate reductase
MSVSSLSRSPQGNLPNAIALHANPSVNYAEKVAETLAILIQAVSQFSPVTQASSLGAEDVVITHLINHHALKIPVFVLETGALHSETLALLERTQAHSVGAVNVFRPSTEKVIAFVKTHGQNAMYESLELRKACCQVRKLEPLAEALKGQRAWVTGLRREQSSNRAEVPFIDRSDETTKGQIKLNPLANWTWGDVWHYISANKVDYNPLHDQFFPSIGCAPCTRAISLGEEFRAGRWWWEDEAAKECGLHAQK